MRVLNVNHLLDPVSGGGTAERTFQLSRFLARAGAECTILTLDIGLTEQRAKELEGVRVVALPCFNHRFFIPSARYLALDGLVQKADVVHLTGHWTLLNALVYLSCRRLGKPYVICPAGALKPFGRSRWLKRVYQAIVGRHIVRSARAWIAVTEEERADFADYGIAASSVTIIPNGIDPVQYASSGVDAAAIDFRKRVRLADAPYILFLGRLNEIKGPDLLLEAFVAAASRFPEMHLVYAGPDGGLLQELESEASRSPCANRVHFIGYIGGLEKVAALNEATLLVIPSRREAMSIVVLEAGICGTPVLFTDRCGLGEIASLGAGSMVEASSDAIQHALCSLLSDLPTLRQSAVRLESLVRDRFLWRTQAERYLSLYSGFAGSAG